MGTANLQLAIVPGFYPISVYNASAATDIPPNTAVVVDAANNINNASVANAAIAVTLPGATTSSAIIGFTSQTIYAGGIGKITPVGPITGAIAYGTINAGSIVDNCTITGFTGRVQSHVASQKQVGINLITAETGETTILILSAAANA